MQKLSDPALREQFRKAYFTNVPAGVLTDKSEAAPAKNWGGARSLDYSLQVEAALTRICLACKDGALTGPTPDLCRVEGAANYVAKPMCPSPSPVRSLLRAVRAPEPPPRQ